MKKKSLSRQFVALFLIFALVIILINGIITYTNKTVSYHRECYENMERLTTHLAGLISKEGDEFTNLKAYFQEHRDLVQIPKDYKSDFPHAKNAFYAYMSEKYPNQSVNEISFEEMDDEARRLYVIYRFEYWFMVFLDAMNEFNMSYLYFLYPVEGKDHTMCYMFDVLMDTVTTEDGREVLFLGDEVYEDPKIHKYMWAAWDEGKAQEKVDSLNNEYGYMYTYCQPLIIDDEKLGLVCSDMSVDLITSEIKHDVLWQSLASAGALMLAVIALFYFLRNRIIERILRLGREVDLYSEQKDPEIAREIQKNAGFNDELGALSIRFSEMITSLEAYMVNLQKVTAEKERIGAELNVATQIQADMLPRIFPAFPEKKEVKIFASMTPAKEVGGDFYDFFLVDDTHLALVIADVSGKGVPAALFMVIAKTLIKNRLQMGESPSEALRNVNNQLCEGNEAELFVTVWAVVVDLETGQVLESNAGHEYPAIRKGNGLYELVKSKHSPAVATFEGLKFRQSEFQMQPGDMLFVYTDGVTEATNAHNELFGEERLLEALNRNPGMAPDELLPSVKKEIDAFVGDAPQFDDITMLSFHYVGKEDR